MSTANNAAPVIETGADAQLHLTSRLAANDFELAYMQLSGLAYSAPADIAAQVADPQQVTPWGGGHWTCSWGPALDADQANLVYVATFINDATGLPVATVLVIRGTDEVDPDTWSRFLGDWTQLKQDLDTLFHTVPSWLPPSTDVRIAQGTQDGLNAILTARFNGQNCAEYLLAALAVPVADRPVLVVTGHSLGGCQTTVMAPYLKWVLDTKLPGTHIVPCSFAAPSAGNQAFARYFAASFPYCPRYYNLLDTIPFWWADLKGLRSVYLPTKPPLEADIFIDFMADGLWAEGFGYAQPYTCNAPLAGQMCPGLDWLAQAGQQHSHLTYIALMQGQTPACP